MSIVSYVILLLAFNAFLVTSSQEGLAVSAVLLFRPVLNVILLLVLLVRVVTTLALEVA